jgi:CO dehydrogenase/acetyl-CoA synthase beta subunit
MIVTKKYIRQLEEYYRFIFPKDLKEELINQLGEDFYPMGYTEQDLWEQTRKIIQEYRNNNQRHPFL